jgi:hypothetical protein
VKKIEKKSAKFKKIRSKRSADDEGTVEFWNPGFWPILLNYRPTSPINHRLFLKIVHAVFGRILVETDRILQKTDYWKEKIVKNNGMTSTKFIHANSQ